jgi:hypothetical protein
MVAPAWASRQTENRSLDSREQGAGSRIARSDLRRNSRSIARFARRAPEAILFALGDSMTHGTMDAANNAFNSRHSYIQYAADSLKEIAPSLWFSQPLWSDRQRRMNPYRIPTNLAVYGSDLFTVEGIRYYKRAGTAQSFMDSNLLSDNLFPLALKTEYDKVLFPINLRARQPVSQMDALIWSLNRLAAQSDDTRAVVVFWIGNNDSGSAALGGGAKPKQIPIPAELIEPEITWALHTLLQFGQDTNEAAFEPYTMSSIQRNLTEALDFDEQYRHLIERIETETILPANRLDIFLFTLPYYTAVGFLFDSEDLEFYLRQVEPAYSVPATFDRVAPPGQPITDPFAGDRVSVMTFGMMYVLLMSGYSVDYVNQALEMNGQQRDGLVITKAERQFVSDRIDLYNETIHSVAEGRPNMHLVDAGYYLNEGLSGNLVVTVGDKTLGRKWIRGSGFSLDGVHPGWTVHALIANFLLEHINAVFDVEAPLHDPEAVLAIDPYIDHDGDGWAPGPDYHSSGATTLAFLFRDVDDNNPDVGVALPRNVWRVISRAMIQDMLAAPPIKAEAERLGITPDDP